MTAQHPVHAIKAPKKLIEVALPLDAINKAAAREKSIRHGHPSTLHLWWARRPLAAARAVIFAQLVNDPSWQWELEHPGEIPANNLKASWAAKRKQLFEILEDLVLWENTTNEKVLDRARSEIKKSWREVCELNAAHPDAATLFDPEHMPGLHDPFAGGGAIPLEAQRLGLEAYATDLNPVAVLINKAMIEIPPKFAGRSPVHPDAAGDPKNFGRKWKGAAGLAEDVRRYGAWMRAQAEQRIGHLYPAATVSPELAAKRPDLKPLVGQQLTVIAWLWARTVKSPNPAFSHVDVPLVSTFVLSSKAGKESYVHPVVDGDRYRFEVRVGTPPAAAKDGTKAPGRGANFRCILSGAPIGGDYIKAEGQAGRMGERLLAIVAEGNRMRVYLPPSAVHEALAQSAAPAWKPEVEFLQQALGFRVGNYGLTKWSDLFTRRQLVALTTFSDLVGEARERARQDAAAAGMPDDGLGLERSGTGATAYGEAVGTYLGLAVSRFTDRNNSLCTWDSGPTGTKSSTGGSARTASLRNLFSRQAIPMAWDFGEANPFSDSGGGYNSAFLWIVPAIAALHGGTLSVARQMRAQEQTLSDARFVSTDPPYYDNIGYADLSDFFYVWLRRALRSIYPSLFATMAVSKAEELVATPYRHGSKQKAEDFFLEGMTQAMRRLAEQAHPSAPITIYYAFKQAETKGDGGTASTGWVTFLESVSRAGLALSGTWPMRTELSNRLRGSDSNALASSIVLVCRKRQAGAATISRRQFIRELNAALPEALDEMTRGSGEERSPVAPVDLSQAIIGPGMAIFSKYAAVLEADGTPMSVKTALQLINRFLAEDDFDADTQFCLRWFEQHGWAEGQYGEADVLARAKTTSVEGLYEAGVVERGGGKVRLLKWNEYPVEWDPATDPRLPIWEALHQLIRALRQGGEAASGRLLAGLRERTEAIRQLAYRLYTLCERQGWAEDARAYNELVTSWAGIELQAGAAPDTSPSQRELL